MPKRIKTVRQAMRESGRTLPHVPRQFEREKTAARGYGAKWAAFARRYLKRHRWCVECERQGRPFVRAYAVDHVVPLRVWKEQGGSKFDTDNLQPLCQACHAIKSAREQHAT